MENLVRSMELDKVLDRARESCPLVHCITNYVTVNDMANVILAAGGSPIMADEIGEIEEIVSIAQTLLLNIGTINQLKLESMIKAGEKARALDKLIVFDPVGIGASKFRKEASKKLIEASKPDIIKANISEIKFLYGESGSQKGVDGEDFDSDSLDNYMEMCKSLAKKYESIIVMTGQVDIITDGSRLGLVKNGNRQMEKITGTGCMLGGVIASLATGRESLFESTLMGLILFSLAGDRALAYIDEKQLGLSSLKTSLIDMVSRLSYEDIKGEMKLEIY